jgi:hypothetical protein
MSICWTGGKVKQTGPATGNKPRFSIPWLVTSLAEHHFAINKALFICIYLFKDAVSILGVVTSNYCGVANNEFERMGKEAIVTYVAYCLVICLESWRKPIKTSG